ncbi:TetR/AcrR family transcriptional regulator [Acidisoma silvae]|uniref:TetR/AcrR family transcriptional regulator n=1 Tax=Acidisoma silvae TaxID=2802396 RepID=A0A963YWF5_9PROT|nr:TetR/AcrR family transcriptional regulator [Acidisoma silvae]MCB8878094.1 TetR/AcrR family transcriptional regulator [Acidisoma silvae]
MSTQPPQRADAAKNRALIVAEARRVFSTVAPVSSLEAIARGAGVGIGTLYRHFPTKEALIEAVYSLELDALEKEAHQLLASHSSFDALRFWLDRYAEFVATKHAMHEAFRIALTFRTGAISETRSRINAAMAKFLAAGARDRSLRTNVRPDDLTLGFAGAVFAATTSSDPEQVGRVLDLLMAGLRPAGT